MLKGLLFSKYHGANQWQTAKNVVATSLKSEASRKAQNSLAKIQEGIFKVLGL